MWELQEFIGDGVIKFGGSGCDVDLRPAVCSEVANMFVIGTGTNCVVICALLSCIPIVTPDYLEEIKKIQGYTFATKPDPKDFLPIMKEEKLTQNDASKFLPNDLRRLLFSGKVFFVLNKDKYNILSEIIRLGNGSSCLLDSPDALLTSNSNNKVHVTGHIAVDDLLRDILSKPESCVVHFHPTSVTESWQRKVYSVLRSLRRRPILESELGFAVVYCSTKLYCNPDKRCRKQLSVSSVFRRVIVFSCL
ncbi:unnamed protein product [Schistosoma mattheei]|uniref:Uncharacterized protein n=1 Tax=Schistosoma mattheei TaxID=31246 RepID=A0A183PUT4_9TREM|nr:unnamed protein product [Schistosoma mattheei]